MKKFSLVMALVLALCMGLATVASAECYASNMDCNGTYKDTQPYAVRWMVPTKCNMHSNCTMKLYYQNTGRRCTLCFWEYWFQENILVQIEHL